MVPTASSPDVIVIGAGVIGLATARSLLMRGLRVDVYEQGRIGRGSASWAAGGILAPLEPDAIDPALTPLLKRSLALYPDWCAQLHAESGTDPEYWTCGLELPDPENPAGWHALARIVDTPILQQGDRQLLFPALAQVRSPRLLAALAASVRHLGGQIHEGQGVRALAGHGRVEGIVLEQGLRSAGQVVLAAGAWSSTLHPACRVIPMHGEMLLFEGSPGDVPRMRLRRGMYLVPRRDGAIVAGSTLADRGFDPGCTADGGQRIREAAEQLASGLAGRRVLHHWSGLRPCPRDGLRCDWDAEREGLYLNTGHYRIGITLAPASAERAADQICHTLPATAPDHARA